MAPKPNALYIWFIDVGMGDATFVRFDNGKTMLIDFGSTKAGSITDDILNFFPNLKQEKFISTTPFAIDYLLITHPDQDHYNLLKYLITNGYSFGKIFFTGDPTDYKAKGQIIDNKNNKWGSFKDWLKDQVKSTTALQLDEPSGNQTWLQEGQSKIHLLAANVANLGSHTTIANNRSIVLMVEHGSRKVLLAGDATYITEEQILDNLANGKLKGLSLNNAILKLGHHGSARTSTSKEWVEAVKPICLFISAERTGEQKGQGNKASGHRLPQQGAIDTVKQFANSLQTTTGYLAIKGNEHPYVAYHDDVGKKSTNCFGKSRSIDNFYDEDKSTKANNLEDQTIKSGDIQTVSNYYYEVKTDKQIFTTICKLDYPLTYTPAGQAKRSKITTDIGTTYGLEIESNGQYMIYPWLEEFEDFSNWEPTDTYFHLGTP